MKQCMHVGLWRLTILLLLIICCDTRVNAQGNVIGRYQSSSDTFITQVEFKDDTVDLTLNPQLMADNQTKFNEFFSFNEQALTRLAKPNMTTEEIQANNEKYQLDFAKLIENTKDVDKMQSGQMALNQLRNQMQGVFLEIQQDGTIHVLVQHYESSEVDGQYVIKALGQTVLRLEQVNEQGFTLEGQAFRKVTE